MDNWVKEARTANRVDDAEQPIRKKVAEYLSNDFTKEKFSKIVNFLDSGALISDTIRINAFDRNLTDFDYLVSGQLKQGNAIVFL